MAAFRSQIILAVNGLPQIHLKSFNRRTRTGRQLVKGMSPDGNPIGHTGGTNEHDLTLEVYIPTAGDIPWESITGAVLTHVPREGGAVETYLGGFVTEVGDRYDEDGKALRTINMMFTRKLP